MINSIITELIVTTVIKSFVIITLEFITTVIIIVVVRSVKLIKSLKKLRSEEIFKLNRY